MDYPFTFRVPTLAGDGPTIELTALFTNDPVINSKWALESIVDENGDTLSDEGPVGKLFFEAVIASLMTQASLDDISAAWRAFRRAEAEREDIYDVTCDRT
jgi:hypothetical protein